MCGASPSPARRIGFLALAVLLADAGFLTLAVPTAEATPAPLLFGDGDLLPVLFLHGIYGNPIPNRGREFWHDPGWNVGPTANGPETSYFGIAMKTLKRDWGYRGAIHTFGYYQCDDAFTNRPPGGTWNDGAGLLATYDVLDRYAGPWGHSGVRGADWVYDGFGTPHNPHSYDCMGLGLPGHNGASHNVDTPIEHLAYHWAWTIYTKFPNQCVNIVAHSMGTLITRYALYQMEAAWNGLAGVGSEHWPPYPQVCVKHVVSYSGPHAGSQGLAEWCPKYQCRQMDPDSTFYRAEEGGLNRDPRAYDPQAYGGTKWSTYTNDKDDYVSMESATHLRAHRWIKFTTKDRTGYVNDYDFDHGEYFWETSTVRGVWSESAYGFESASVKQRDFLPLRQVFFDLKYGEWRCGNTLDPQLPALPPGQVLVGQPNTMHGGSASTFACAYQVTVAQGQPTLDLQTTTPSGRTTTVAIHGAVSYPNACTASPGSTTCRVPSPAPGIYVVTVTQPVADDAFAIRYGSASQSDCGHARDAPSAYADALHVRHRVECVGATTGANADALGFYDGADWYRTTLLPGQYAHAFVIGRNVDEDFLGFRVCAYGPWQGERCATGAQWVDHSTAASGVERWLFRVDGATGTYQLVLRVNDAPTRPSVTCDKTMVFRGERVTCTAVASDRNGDRDLAYEFVWPDGYTEWIRPAPGEPATSSHVYSTTTFWSARLLVRARDHFDTGPFGASFEGASTASFSTASLPNPEAAPVAALSASSASGPSASSGTRPGDLGAPTEILIQAVSDSDDCGTGVDASESRATATPLQLPVRDCVGYLAPGEVEDNYAMTLPAGTVVRAVATPFRGGSDLLFCFYSPLYQDYAHQAVPRRCAHEWNSMTPRRVAFRVPDAEGGRWVAELYNYRREAAYQMTIETGNNAPETPSLACYLDSQSTATVWVRCDAGATDPDGDRVAYRFDWDDGTTSTSETVPSGTWVSARHAYPRGLTFTVRVQAIDEFGRASPTAQRTAPEGDLPAPLPPPAPAVACDPAVAEKGRALMCYALSPHPTALTYTFDWGDGTPPETVSTPAGVRLASRSHTYASAGSHLLRVSATDAAGRASPATTLPVVVIDPLVRTSPERLKPEVTCGKFRGWDAQVECAIRAVATDLGTVTYTIDWDDMQPGPAWYSPWERAPPETRASPSGVPVVVERWYNTPGWHTIRVTATDSTGAREETTVQVSTGSGAGLDPVGVALGLAILPAAIVLDRVNSLHCVRNPCDWNIQ